MWKVIQYLIVSTTVVANVHFGWTPNSHLAGLIGILLHARLLENR